MCLGLAGRKAEFTHFTNSALTITFSGPDDCILTYNELCLPLRAVKATQLIEFEIEALWTVSTHALEAWRYVAKVI
jgi:hypothetical protein